MTFEQHRSKPALSKGFINLQDHQYLNTSIMDLRTAKNPSIQRKIVSEGRKLDYCRSFSQGSGKRVFRYFTVESLLLLVCLTATLLILPLILPPLPPPPSLLLLVPICILVLLMFLAFTPSNVRDSNYTYA